MRSWIFFFQQSLHKQLFSKKFARNLIIFQYQLLLYGLIQQQQVFSLQTMEKTKCRWLLLRFHLQLILPNMFGNQSQFLYILQHLCKSLA
ncbi:unnamed protein product [Paramecium sonneborni]|uniref:Uncharacterized protein n=1 Tax=Paramecium sonneborni TaxID=65129 RepID=A0A8S1QIX5_9CILI|nr:unnamed protein product [Paramecium sonneborni]